MSDPHVIEQPGGDARGSHQRLVVPLASTITGQLCLRYAGKELYAKICAEYDCVKEGKIQEGDYCIDYGPNGWNPSVVSVGPEHIGNQAWTLHAVLVKRHNNESSSATTGDSDAGRKGNDGKTN